MNGTASSYPDYSQTITCASRAKTFARSASAAYHTPSSPTSRAARRTRHTRQDATGCGPTSSRLVNW